MITEGAVMVPKFTIRYKCIRYCADFLLLTFHLSKFKMHNLPQASSNQLVLQTSCLWLQLENNTVSILLG